MELAQVSAHNLKHTFRRKFRAAGVYLEDKQGLLGLKAEKITTPCSADELETLIEAANKGVWGRVPQKSRTGNVKAKSSKVLALTD